MTETYYVTTPIYYVNDMPHIGHAYTTIAADTLARFHSLVGKRTFFLTGTDEHGQKVERAAQEQGLTPQALADRVVERYHHLWERLRIDHTDFIRTTETRHKIGVEALFHRVLEKGDIYLGEYEGWYCTSDESFWTETQLVEKKCPECGRSVERIRESSYFFRLSKYQEPLLQYFEKHPRFILPETRRNEIISFVKGGLRDLSISRTSFEWGIPVPNDPGHVLYVWFDALTNYISALGFGQDGAEENYQTFWPANVHLIGKDILRFHAVYWPAFLMSAELPLPDCVAAHGWWTVEGQKMSKSLRNVVEPNRLLDQYGTDAVRYFVLREIPFGEDGDFSHESLIDRINSDLANDLGNLLHRTIGMIDKFCNRKIPPSSDPGSLERKIKDAAEATTGSLIRNIKSFEFQPALKSIWGFIGQVNKYLDERAPWAAAKAGQSTDVETTLNTAAEALQSLSVWLWPFMPESMMKIRSAFGLSKEYAPRSLDEGCCWNVLPVGGPITLGPPLFPRIEADQAEEIKQGVVREISAETKEITADSEVVGKEGKLPSASRSETEGVVMIDHKGFSNVSLRTATIVSAEKVEKSKNLLMLKVDMGNEERTVVAGIAESYHPEELPGKSVVIVSNLKPRKLMGIQSEGMILAARQDKDLVLVTVDRPILPGSIVQ